MLAVGIARDPTYTPGRHSVNDRLILELTAAALRKHGWSVRLMAEEDVGKRSLGTRYVFSMCQGPRATALLAGLERQGYAIVNSPAGVQKCYRERLFDLPADLRDVFPETLVVSTRSPDRASRRWIRKQPLWVKRGDVQATCPEDVQRVESTSQMEDVLAGFAARGIERAVVQQHVDGKVVKFYGVIGSSFFRFYMESDHASAPAAVGQARSWIERVIRHVGLGLYGGDCVLQRDGGIAIIDVNDWPSFSYFRDEAAAAIARYVACRFQLHRERALERPGGRVST